MSRLTAWCMVQFDDGESGWSGQLYSRRKQIGSAQLMFNPKDESSLLLVGLEIFTQYRRQGYASFLLEETLREFSDRYSEIRLAAQPFGEIGFDKDQLESFYARHGFERCAEVKGYAVMRKTI